MQASSSEYLCTKRPYDDVLGVYIGTETCDKVYVASTHTHTHIEHELEHMSTCLSLV
jgi:hypothetical protein